MSGEGVHLPAGTRPPRDLGNVQALLVDIAQILDVVKIEWAAASSWSGWDQGVRDRISATLWDIHRAHPDIAKADQSRAAADRQPSPREASLK